MESIVKNAPPYFPLLNFYINPLNWNKHIQYIRIIHHLSGNECIFGSNLSRDIIQISCWQIQYRYLIGITYHRCGYHIHTIEWIGVDPFGSCKLLTIRIIERYRRTESQIASESRFYSHRREFANAPRQIR